MRPPRSSSVSAADRLREILREQAHQPRPHDELVEGPAEPADAELPLAGVLAMLSRTPLDPAGRAVVAAWASQRVGTEVFPAPEEDDPGARAGEALMVLSALEQVPLSPSQAAELAAFVRGERGWAAWYAQLQAILSGSSGSAGKEQR